MKKIGLAFLTIGLLVCGFVAADPGVPQVNEVQGLSIETTVIAVGNFDQESSVYISSSAGQSLNDMPPLASGGAVVYESVYTEDTQTAGIGYISYDKSFDVDTSDKVSGQYNIESTRQITFVGIDAGSIYSSEYLMMSGSGTAGGSNRMICPFAGDTTTSAFCNKVESGSTFSMSVANVLTQANARFITKSGDSPVELNYNIQVSEYSSGIPSKGSVAAFIKGKVNEGGRNQTPYSEDAGALFGTGEFADRTEIIGDISLFSKQMHYESAWA
jgi:hypothetical protein